MSILSELPTLEEHSQAKQDYPLSAVPWSDRRSIWSLAPLLMGFALTSTTLFAGGTLGKSFAFGPMLGLIIGGNIALAAYCTALGYIASQSGLSTVLMARFSFGRLGARWVDFVLGFTQIGWYAVTNAFIASALTKLLGWPPSLEWLAIAFFTYAFCATAYIGYTAMDWLSRLAVPAMLILIAVSLGLATRDLGSFERLWTLQPQTSMPLGAALALVIGTFISGGTQATNWSRYADSGKNAIMSTLLAFLGVNTLLVFAGAFCTLVYGSEDLIAAMGKQGILLGGLVLLILNVWTTQDNTIYNFSVAGANFFGTTKRTAFVLGGATLALVLALVGVYNLLIPYLIILGSVIPPIGGIIMADFWFKHRGRFPTLESNTLGWNKAGLIAYVTGSLVSYFTAQANLGVGPLNGIVIAALIYSLLSRRVTTR